MKDEAFIRALKELNADLFVIVAFKILPRSVFTIPKAGSFNLHGSLLPKYRGAAPIHWAIINGETETGITTFHIEKEMDAGDIILQESVSIGPDETAPELMGRLEVLGAELLLRALQQGRLAPALDRDRLKRSTVNLDGRQVRALRLPPDLAEALGLRPGDVVIVERRAVTTTSTAPGGAAAATRPAASGPGAEPPSP